MFVRFGLIVALSMSIACASASVAKADSGFYIGGSAGAGFREDDTRQRVVEGAQGPASQTLNYQSTAAGAFTFNGGYRFDLGASGAVRTEVEFGYARYSLGSVAISTAGQPDRRALPSSGAEIDNYTGTVNLFYDVPLGGSIVPYFGGGLGFGHENQSDGTGTVTGASIGPTFPIITPPSGLYVLRATSPNRLVLPTINGRSLPATF